MAINRSSDPKIARCTITGRAKPVFKCPVTLYSNELNDKYYFLPAKLIPFDCHVDDDDVNDDVQILILIL